MRHGEVEEGCKRDSGLGGLVGGFMINTVIITIILHGFFCQLFIWFSIRYGLMLNDDFVLGTNQIGLSNYEYNLAPSNYKSTHK